MMPKGPSSAAALSVTGCLSMNMPCTATSKTTMATAATNSPTPGPEPCLCDSAILVRLVILLSSLELAVRCRSACLFQGCIQCYGLAHDRSPEYACKHDESSTAAEGWRAQDERAEESTRM